MKKCCICDKELKEPLEEYGHIFFPLCLDHWFSHAAVIDEIISSTRLYNDYNEIQRQISEIRICNGRHVTLSDIEELKKQIEGLEDERSSIQRQIDDLEGEEWEISTEIKKLEKRLENIEALV